MNYQEKTVLLKNGKTCLLRRPEEADAETLVGYLKDISTETRNVLREPEEVRTSAEEEAEFIRKNRADARALMLSAFVDGKLAGNASFAAVSDRGRVRHRCRMGISVYRKFWGMGIGRWSWRWFPQIFQQSRCTRRWDSRPQGPSPMRSSTRTGPTPISFLW